MKIASFADLRDPREVQTKYDIIRTLRLGRIETVKGPVEQSGLLGSVSSINVLSTRRGRFTFADVGKEITISGSSIITNNSTVIVTNIVSPFEVLTNPPLSPDPGNLRWELRALEASTRQETIVQVLAGDVEDIAPGWILSDGLASFTVTKRRQFKLASAERKLLTLREGSDGSIGITLRFASPTLALTSKDVGRKLTISNTVYPENNEGKFEIVDVLSATECILDSTEIVAEPTGTLVWALLRDPELTLYGSATLRGTVEQSGGDGVVATATNFTAFSAQFSSTDVGKLLTIHKPGAADNGTYEIVSILSVSGVTVDPVFTAPVVSGFHWEVRTPTDIGDETQVQVYAPDLLQYLAQDFGVEIDAREEEEWQRRWVESVSRWIGLKGHENGYKYLAELTGFTAVVTGLYRVSQDKYNAVLAVGAQTYVVGEDGSGRYGTDGSLNVVGSDVQFSSPTASFENWDVGRQIEVTGTAGSTNDGIRTIVTVINSTTVEFRPTDTMVGSSDGNNGSIEWRVVRLYADQAPTIPVYDEIDTDYMTYLKTANVFVVDKYCWEQTPLPWSTLLGPGSSGDGVIFIISSTPSVVTPFPTSYLVVGRGDFDVIVGLDNGKWKLTDSTAVEHFIETIPTLGATEVSGSNGSLTTPGALSRFSVSSGTPFASTDVGKRLVISGSGSGNDGTYIIDTYVSSTAVDLSATHAPATPDANNGSLVWSLHSYEFTVIAISPVATGAASIEYLCPEIVTCDYCRSNRALVEASTPYLLEKGFERLRDRLEQGTPKHVELIEDFGFELNASLSLTATVDSP